MKLTTASTALTGKAGDDITVSVSVEGDTAGKEVRYHFKEKPQDGYQPPTDWDEWSKESSATLKVEEKNVRVWGATEESGAPKPFDEYLTISIEPDEEAPDSRLGTAERIYDPEYADQMRRWILIPAGILSGILVVTGIFALFVFGGSDNFERTASALFSGLGIVVLVATGAMIAGGGIYLMAVEHRATLPRNPTPQEIEAEQITTTSAPVDPESLKEFRKMPAPWAVMLVAAVALVSAAWVGGRLASNPQPSPTPTPAPTSTVTEPSQPIPAPGSPSPGS